MEAARAAEEADVPAIVDLARHAAEELTPRRGGALWAATLAREEPLAASFEHTLASDEEGLFVGTIDDVVVGYAAVRRQPLRDGHLLAVIDDLYVETEARSVGVGEQLMGRLLDWADAQGCDGIDAVALPGERATKNFFESAGLKARAILVHRSLHEPGDDRPADTGG